MTHSDWTHVVISAVAIGLAGACSSGDDDGAANGGGAGGGAGTSPMAGSGGGEAGDGAAGSGDEPKPEGPFYGPFVVQLFAATAVGVLGEPRPARTDVTGFIRDGVQPERAGWEMIDEIGDCQLYVPNPPSCIPGCDTSTEICAPGDMCLRNPKGRTVGTVMVDGLGERFELEDKVVGNYALPVRVGTEKFTLPYPPCSEGSPVTLEIEGDGPAPFTLETPCVATVEAPEPVTIASGQPIELRWDAPAMPQLATLLVELDIASHGGNRGQLLCETDDDGELDIDAALVDGLINLGTAGFPTIILKRRTSTSGTGPSAENLSLTVFSSYESPVAVEGVVSCTMDSECPDGGTCGTDLRCY